MVDITLRQLRYFCAVARLGHFGRAADQCAISQPALSQQVRELEAQLGTVLVDRSSRRIGLTAAGREVAQRGEAILRAVEDMHGAVRAAKARVRLRLGLIPTVAPYMLPDLLAELACGPIELIPIEAKTARLLEALREGRLDGAVVALPVAEAGLHEEPLLTENFLLARPEAAADEPIPRPGDLLESGLLLLEEGHCLRDQTLAYCSAAPQGDLQRIEGSALSTLVQIVAAGRGITLLPQMAVPLEMRAAPISVAAMPDPAPSRQLGLVWRARSPLAAHLVELSGVIKAIAARA
ncbi:MAG: LysR substrate-binding domain-containing protein [Paracoccus sp. (in: a-proteobacteria)]|nr:LysR substrate-binding domain-containing protein [Paracoccus sp. (in: a-proteobacteria)]